jgi:hypothetical protein
MANYNYLKTLCAALISAAIPQITFAQSNIGEVRDRIANIETQVEILQKESQLVNARREYDKTIFADMKEKDLQISGNLPYILSISMVGPNWSTRLQFDTGIIRTFTEGELIFPAVRVLSIDLKGVTIEKLTIVPTNGAYKQKAVESYKKTHMMLPFATVGSSNINTNQGMNQSPTNQGFVVPSLSQGQILR